jgi:hypothetical protein
MAAKFTWIEREHIDRLVADAEANLEARRPHLAEPPLLLAGKLIRKVDADADRLGRIAGVTVGGLLGAISVEAQGNTSHPVAEVILFIAAGFVAGKKGAEVYKDTLAPTRIRLYRALGDLARQNADHSAAREHYAKALLVDPHDAMTAARLAEVF